MTPRIRVTARAPRESATPFAEYVIQRAMTWDADSGWRELFDTRLLPDEQRNWRVPIAPGEGAEILVTVEPDADYRDRVYPTLLRELAADLTTGDKDRLRAALDASGRSPFLLYRLICPSWSGTSVPCQP